MDVNSLLTNDSLIAAIHIGMAVFLLPGILSRSQDSKIKMLLTWFIAHLIFQISSEGSGNVYRDYLYSYAIDGLLFVACYLSCQRKLILFVSFLFVPSIILNMMGLSYYILHEDIEDFLDRIEPAIICITFIQTLLLAYETYGRDWIKRFNGSIALSLSYMVNRFQRVEVDHRRHTKGQR